MSSTTVGQLRGLRVMVAEDDGLIAHMIRGILLDLGCTVIGPFRKLEDVMHGIHTNGVDGALLDVQLGKESVYPAAQELALRDTPFILVTGQRNLDSSSALAGDAPLLTKPFTIRQLEDMMRITFGRGEPHKH
jgi:DNA-binding response OmpR family regulator